MTMHMSLNGLIANVQGTAASEEETEMMEMTF